MKSSAILILFLASVVVRAVFDQLFHHFAISEANATNLSMAAQYLIIILIGMVFVKRSSLNISCILGRISKSRDVFIGTIFGILLIMVTLGLSALIVIVVSYFSVDMAYAYGGFHENHYFVDIPWYSFVILFVSHFLLASIGEEWLFRGILLHSMMQIYSRIRSVMVVSIAFGLLHYGKDMFGAFIFSVLLCALYFKYGSLYQVVIAHFVYNVIAYVVTYKFDFFFERSSEQISGVTNWLPELVMLVGSACFMIHFFCRRTTQTQPRTAACDPVMRSGRGEVSRFLDKWRNTSESD